ncbi:MAG: hypothetical protein C0598_06580 [Marinilabiliales bacterium]|nr:MAG: hypothetical protein C0598_06580 [Marinilabiliales bacterium]
MKWFSVNIVLLVMMIFILACGTSVEISENQSANKKNEHKLSETVNEIMPSILKIDVLGFYKTWYFGENDNILKDDIDYSKIDSISVFSDIRSESMSGTAIVLYVDEDFCGLLTCAHVVSFPDTIYTYFDLNETLVKSVSIMQEQNIYESGRPLRDEYGIIVTDEKMDLAFLKKSLLGEGETPKVFPLEAGDVNKLNWGSEIFVLGYPLGKLMLTDGIVSLDKSKNIRFISNALFNKGISGSPVFGLQEGSDDFLWLGMASSAASQSLEYFEPLNNDFDITRADFQFYNYAVARNKQFINYGVTYSISIEEILTFVSRNKNTLEVAGFETDLIISNKN